MSTARIAQGPGDVNASRLCACNLRTKLVGDGCEVCNPKLAEELTNTTKDGIVVEPGQVWRDLDKRMCSGNRHCKVASVRDGKAIMFLCKPSGVAINAQREVKVSVRRMHKSSTGWQLVKMDNARPNDPQCRTTGEHEH